MGEGGQRWGRFCFGLGVCAVVVLWAERVGEDGAGGYRLLGKSERE